jgi:dienelactone hydrolase
VVSFHGSLTTEQPAKPGQVVTSLLVLNGADDPLVKPADIDGFKKEMLAAGIDYQFINYPGAVHAFTNPEADTYGKKFNLPLAYNARADQESWTEMRGFLDRIFTR